MYLQPPLNYNSINDAISDRNRNILFCGSINHNNFYKDGYVVRFADTLSVGLSELNKGAIKVFCFPNPASDYVSFYFNSNESNSLNIKSKIIIYNTIGQPVFERFFTAKNSVFTIEIKNFTKGLYYYSIIKNEKNSYTGKLIIN